MIYYFKPSDDIPTMKQWLGKNLRKKRGESKKYKYLVKLKRRWGSNKIIGSTYLGVDIFDENDMMLFKLSVCGVKNT